MFEAIIVGNVGSVKFYDGKTPVLNFSVASTRRVGDREFTDWIAAKIWGERGQKLAAHISKGMRLLVRGRPEAKGYSKQDGSVAGELILHVNEVEFLSPKPKTGEENPDGQTAAEPELGLKTYDTPSAAETAAAGSKTRRQSRG